MNKELGCGKSISPYTSCGDINFSNKIVLCKDCENTRRPHEEFEREVIEKTKPLTVPEESDECMREGYEHDPKVRGPRSRPEQARRLKKAFKEYEDKFDADGSMVAATKDVLSEERMIEEMIVEKEKELELMHEKNDSGEHISMAKKELRELKYKLKKAIYNDANCEGDENENK